MGELRNLVFVATVSLIACAGQRTAPIEQPHVEATLRAVVAAPIFATRVAGARALDLVNDAPTARVDPWVTTAVRLPARADGATTLELLGRAGASLSIRSVGSAPVRAALAGNAVVYARGAALDDVVTIATPDGVEEFRVVDRETTHAHASYTIALGPALARLRVRDGVVEALDHEDSVVFACARPFALDAHGVRREAEVSLDGSTLSVDVDTAGLVPPVVIDPTWTSSPMPTSVQTPQIGVLSDGRVYVVRLPNVMVFNPATSTWKLSAAAPVARSSYAHAPISAGRVLFAAGYAPGATSTAEVYDATADTWTTKRALPVADSGPTGVGLSSGGALVVLSNKAAYVYDPATDLWAAAGTAPSTSTMVGLLDGRVFMGPMPTVPSPPAIFDPTSKTWTTVPMPAEPRTGGAMVALPGKLLMAGGTYFDTGAPYGIYSSATTEILDLASKTWSRAPSMSTRRAQPGGTLLPNGRVLVAGGAAKIASGSSPGVPLSTAEVFDPATSTWQLFGAMTAGRYGAAAATAGDGRALVIGPAGYTAPSSTADIFAPLALGATCAQDAECANGRCVDNVCCATACSGQCEACDVAGSRGTCTAVAGAPHGARPACSDGGGDPCKVQRCDGSLRTSCRYEPAGSRACGVTGCTAGVETRTSTCDGFGFCGDVPKSCGAYTCGGTTCRTSCAADTECSAGFRCVGSVCVTKAGLGETCATTTECRAGLSCVDSVCCGLSACGVGETCAATGHRGTCIKTLGTACGSGVECASGNCADGVCCDSACNGICEACDVKDKAGTCTPVLGAPHGSRTCGATTTDVCAQAACDGSATSACNMLPGTATECRKASCSEGVATAAASCDGKGACAAVTTSSCNGFRCDGAACRTTCTTDAQCMPDFECGDGVCRKRTATCSPDGTSVIDSKGGSQSCAPYRCEGGACKTSCSATAECAAGTVCDLSINSCVPAATGDTSEESGGCNQSRSGPVGGLGVVLFASLLWCMRRKTAVAALAVVLIGCARREPEVVDLSTPSSRAAAVIARVRKVEALANHAGLGGRLESRAGSYRLVGATSDGPFAATGGGLDVRAPIDAHGALLVGIAGEPGVSLEVRADAPAAPTIAVEAALVAENISVATDLLYVVEPARVEDLRVLNDSRATPRATSTITLGSELADVRYVDDHLEAIDRSGRVRLRTEPLLAHDARGVARALTVSLEGTGAHRLLTVSVDPTGLAYPIVLDPAWTAAGNLAVGRSSATATLLASGKVLIAGGATINPTDGVYTREGAATADLYDPTTRTFTAAAPMAVGRERHSATLASGKVIVIGGRTQSYFGGFTYPLNIERYDTATNTWSLGAAPPRQRSGHTASVLAGGQILVVGGDFGSASLTNVDQYDPVANAWSVAASLATARTDHTATTLVDGRILVVGGANGSTVQPSAEVFNGTSWTTIATPIAKRRSHTATRLSTGKVLILGGSDGVTALSTTALFDPSTNTFTAAAPLLAARSGHTATLLSGDRVLVVGGANGSLSVSTTEVYDATAGVSREISPTIERRLNHTATLLGDGSVLIAGGDDQILSFVSAEVFKPQANGATCLGRDDCSSLSCADRVCCNVACAGKCEACDVSGSVGTCTAVSGDPHGTRGACFNAGSDTCKTTTCDGVDTTKCVNVKGVACGADRCRGGIEYHPGTCDGAGGCTAVTKMCGAYACGAIVCKTSCTVAADCAPGGTCVSGACVSPVTLGEPCTATTDCAFGLFCTDGVCCGVAACSAGSSCNAGTKGTCTKLIATACSADTECGSGHCVDGVCCATACSGQCEACDVAGKTGSCVPVAGKPHGSKPPCATSGDPCGAALCDGATVNTCAGYVGADVRCRETTCTDGTVTQAAACSGMGSCPPAVTTACNGFACADDGASCRTSCSADTDCASGFTCSGGKCDRPVAECSEDGRFSRTSAGNVVACSPYRCSAGACLTACATSADCQSGLACDVGSKQCTGASTDDGGGCVMGHESSDASWPLALLAVVLGLGLRRSRAVHPERRDER